MGPHTREKSLQDRNADFESVGKSRGGTGHWRFGEKPGDLAAALTLAVAARAAGHSAFKSRHHKEEP
jgi:hypothetical protein